VQIKILEVRDIATFIPIIAIKAEPNGDEQKYLLERAGYYEPFEQVILVMTDGGAGTCNMR